MVEVLAMQEHLSVRERDETKLSAILLLENSLAYTLAFTSRTKSCNFLTIRYFPKIRNP
jgi:hypothetical protein